MYVQITGLSEFSHYKLEVNSHGLLSQYSNCNCPVCNSGETSNFYRVVTNISAFEKRQELNKLVCQNCGHSFFDKVFNANASHKFYEDVWDASVNVLSKPREVRPNFSEWSPVHHLLDLELKKNSTILDFGCGDGDSIAALQTHGFSNVYGIEIGAARAKIAFSNFPGKILHGNEDDVASLTEQVGKFDLIYSNHVFEHLAEPQGIIKKLKSCLSSNGLLVISVPAPGSETIIHSALYYPHHHCYSAQSLKKLLNNIGLDAWVWLGSSNQLAVVGAQKKWKPKSANFSSIGKCPKQTIKRLHECLQDAKSILSSVGLNTELAINFCHPKTNLINKKSGLTRLSTFKKFLLKISDTLICVIGLIVPVKAIFFLKRVYRTVYYRLRIGNSVDNIYVKIDDFSEQKGQEFPAITFYAKNNKIFLGK